MTLGKETEITNLDEEGNVCSAECDVIDSLQDADSDKDPLFSKFDDLLKLDKIHAQRIERLREISCLVGKKRARETAFTNFTFGNQVGELYLQDGVRKLFRPAEAYLPEKKFRFMRRMIKMSKRARGIKYVMVASEAEKCKLIDVVLDSVVLACDKEDQVEIKSEVPFKCKQLNALGRVDRVITKRGQKAIVLECKKNDFDQGMGQMALATEGLLLEQLEENSESKDPVFGIVSNFLHWSIMKLDRHGARFCEIDVNEVHMTPGLREISSALFSILRGDPVEDIEEDGDSDSEEKSP